MVAEGLWTIGELSAMVAEALVDYPGPPSGRVREVPDRRTIRWYTTIGLLDRPASQRGRTALYGHRHLLQLVAIKRMQAVGLSLTAIQERLYGATDTMLTRIARPTTNGDTPVSRRARLADSTPARVPASSPVFAAGVGPAKQPNQDPPPNPESSSRTAQPLPTAPAAPTSTDVPAPGRFWAVTVPDQPAPQLVHGIRLDDSVTLVLPPGARVPDADDLAAIQEAAGPLLAVLRQRGLAAK